MGDLNVSKVEANSLSLPLSTTFNTANREKNPNDFILHQINFNISFYDRLEGLFFMSCWVLQTVFKVIFDRKKIQ